MNPIAEEIRAVREGRLNADELMHYGMPRRSGRYPYGSGEDPYQHTGDFLSRVEKLQKQKDFEFVDKDGTKYTGNTAIAKSLGMTTTQFRKELSIAKDERRALQVETARSMREHGVKLQEIADRMGFKNESSVRALLDSKAEFRMNQAKNTANELKKLVNEKGMLDVGTGVERELNISKEKLGQALKILEAEGYPTYGGGVAQVTNPGKQTNLKVLCPPGTEHKDIYPAFNEGKISSVKDYISRDGGDTIVKKFQYPESMDSNRLSIVYAEDGGTKRDGLIELRRGVPDLSLGESHYAQVRILVDGTHYLKGMAVYADDLPDGVDVRFNTNKTKDKTKYEVMKEIKNDPDNPFGSAIKEKGGQSEWVDKDGNKHLSLINKRGDEGDWGEWKDKLPAQFLSKQNRILIEKQLGLALADKQSEYDEIKSLTNPTIKKQMLNSFAEDCDSAAVHLYAAALPRQKYQVILPIPSLKDDEIYAPNFKNGEKLALIRYPHGGTFEIPIVTVNNKHAEAIKLMGTDAKDAVGINSKVAERLSGADFDGDTVMVIPTNAKTKITSTPALQGLVGFDDKLVYGCDRKEKGPDGEYHYFRNDKEYKVMKNTQTEMGKITNLITDMTLKGAELKDLECAVRHSMVVIDAEKHKLDYKQSEIDNNIKYLKEKYQGHYDAEGNFKTGAGTLISRAKGEITVDKRQGQPHVNIPGTKWYDPSRPDGSLIYQTADNLTYEVTKTNRRGEVVTQIKTRTQPSTQMAETDDAHTLSSGHPTEKAYGDYANSLKALANQARLEAYNTKPTPYSASAKATYRGEVDHLLSQLNVSLLNAPRERQAQLMATAEVNAKKQSNPGMTKADIKKASQQALSNARQMVGAERRAIKLSDREWEAIQAGAVPHTQLEKIIKYVDKDELRERATPQTRIELTPAKQSRIKALRASGYTVSEIAESLGVSPSTISKYSN